MGRTSHRACFHAAFVHRACEAKCNGLDRPISDPLQAGRSARASSGLPDPS